jgi:hypothetical protein
MTRPAPTYQLTFTEHPEYLRADLTAETISAEIIRAYISEIVAKSNATGKNCVLLYRDIPAVLSAGEMFHTVNESLEALRGKKVALVNPHPSIHENVEFGVTVGKNRGGNYRTFNDVPTAQAWLLSNVD